MQAMSHRTDLKAVSAFNVYKTKGFNVLKAVTYCCRNDAVNIRRTYAQNKCRSSNIKYL